MFPPPLYIKAIIKENLFSLLVFIMGMRSHNTQTLNALCDVIRSSSYLWNSCSYKAGGLKKTASTISSVNNTLEKLFQAFYYRVKVFQMLKNQERKQWITGEEEMNLKEIPNKAEFIILSSWFIFLVWTNICFFFRMTWGSWNWHFSLTKHGERNAGSRAETELSAFTASIFLYCTLFSW